MKVVKIEMVRWSKEEETTRETAEKEATRALETIKRPRVERTPMKSISFPAGHEEDMAPALLDVLPTDVRCATASFYKFWTDRWQMYMSTCDVLDLTKAMVSQSVWILGIALEC